MRPVSAKRNFPILGDLGIPPMRPAVSDDVMLFRGRLGE
jgi:hypothetical protein